MVFNYTWIPGPSCGYPCSFHDTVIDYVTCLTPGFAVTSSSLPVNLTHVNSPIFPIYVTIQVPWSNYDGSIELNIHYETIPLGPPS